MKRVGGLFLQIAGRGNLREAVGKAMPGKRDRTEVRAILADLEANLSRLGTSIFDGEIDWFALEDDEYRPIPLDDGLLRSRVFPGLALPVAAALTGDLAAVLGAVRK